MKKQMALIGMFLLVSNLYGEGFDFSGSEGGGCEGGNKTFEQDIPYKDIIEIPGTIPVGIKNLYVSLKSEKDIDIQLYDKDNGKAIVKWAKNAEDEGILHGSMKDSTPYEGMNIEWSGYNGDGKHLGYEYIKVDGDTTKNLTMKVYGFKEGFATVNYSWEADDNCIKNSTPSASGVGEPFEQQILYKDVVEVEGTIPPGIDNLYISLTSENDVDVQLFDKDNNKALVGWGIDALIGDGSGQATTPYNGMTIEYSGYHGVDNKWGNEYIKITGKTTNNLIMKAYGFKAGYAKIEYKWGQNNKNTDNCTAPDFKHLFKIDNPTCIQKWDMYSRLKYERVLSSQRNIITSKMNGTDTGHEKIKLSLELVDYIVDPTGKTVSEVGKRTVKYGLESLFPNGNSDYIDGLAGIISDVAIQSVQGTIKPHELIEAKTTQVLGIFNDLFGSFVLDGLTEEMYTSLIVTYYLEEYYAWGGDKKKVAISNNISKNSSLEQIIDAIANKHGNYNNWWGTEYHTDEAKKMIENIVNNVIPPHMAQCLTSGCK